MTTPPPAAAHGGPTTLAERALAPDFARGAMLLFIVLSNTAYHLYGAGVEGDSALDTVARFLAPILIDVRSYPLFAFLFGYGVTQLAARQRRAGAPASRVRRLLRRRGWWLFGFGLVHAALLLGSEVLAAYGLLSLLLVWLFLNRRDRTILITAAVGTAILLAVYLLSAGSLLFTDTTAAAARSTGYVGEGAFGVADPSWLSSGITRLASWTVLLGVNLFGVVMAVAMLLGMWAARRRILEEPARHLRLLTAVALGGLGIGLTGSLPVALSDHTTATIHETEHGLLLFGMQWTSGLAAGIGYAALFGLLAYRFGRRDRPVAAVTAIRALGKRSLSGYLTHSLLMAPLLAAWGLGLGDDLSPAGVAAFAVGLWLATVLGAYLLERAGRRGPAEVLLRRLVYRPG